MSSAPINRSQLLSALERRTGKSSDEILKEVQQYNTQFSSYDNAIYSRVSTRLAHWWNYEDQNWFARRIDLYLEQLRHDRNVMLVDIGFSVPYLYAVPYFAERTDIAAVLVDKERSAELFYQIITDLASSSRRASDHIVIADIEEDEGQFTVVSVLRNAMQLHHPKSILVVASEVVEHLSNTRRFWQLISTMGMMTRIPLLLYITLPIGDKIPSHTVSFATEGDALSMISQWIEIRKYYVLRPPSHNEESPYLRACVCVFGYPKAI